MPASEQILICLVPFVGALYWEWRRIRGPQTVKARVVTVGLLLAGLAVLSVYLVQRSTPVGLPPLLRSTHDWMLVLAWLLVAILMVSLIRSGDVAFGLFMLPLIIFLICAAYFMSRDANGLLTEDTAWKRLSMLHASSLVLGMGGVACGFISALMYLVQHWRLRHPSRTTLLMPNLAKLAHANRLAVLIAFPLLTVGMVTGVILGLRSQDRLAHFSFADPTVVLSSIVWLLLAIVFCWLLLRHQPSGKRIAWLTLCAFGFLLLTLIGLKVMTGSHLLPGASFHADRLRDTHNSRIVCRALVTGGRLS